MKTRSIFVAATLLLAVAVQAQERYVKPFDEAKLDPSFVAFRAKLISAAERRDSKYILSILDPKIQLSFGGHEGVQHFKELWEIDKKDSKFWKEFLAVIRNGGRYNRENGKRQNLFYAPFTFTEFPEDLDAFDHAVIYGNNVNLRKTASETGEVVTKLSYNVVVPDRQYAVDENLPEPKWIKLVTLGGKAGFVHTDLVRSPIDYRAGFEKKRGIWKMVTFISGD